MKKKLSYLLLFILIACGGDSGNSDDFEREEEPIPEPETLQKIYRGDFKGLNDEHTEGQVIIRLEDVSFEVNIAARNVPTPGHRLAVLTGKSCPDTSADVNGDGVLSPAEATDASGSTLISLDSDLDNLSGDNGEYPNGGFIGAFAYREVTERQNLVATLGAESTIDFGNRVVMIFGSDDDETLPIGCSELTQITGD